MRMHLNNDYAVDRNNINWHTDTVDLKKSIQLHDMSRHHHKVALNLVKEIELHEKSIDREESRDRTEVIRIFQEYFKR